MQSGMVPSEIHAFNVVLASFSALDFDRPAQSVRSVQLQDVDGVQPDNAPALR